MIYKDCLGLEYHGSDIKEMETPDIIIELMEEFEKCTRLVALATELKDRHPGMYCETKHDLEIHLSKYVKFSTLIKKAPLLAEGREFVSELGGGTKYYIYEGKLITINKEDEKFTYKEASSEIDFWLKDVKETNVDNLRKYEKIHNEEIWDKADEQLKLRIMKEGYIGIKIDEITNMIKEMEDSEVAKSIKKQLGV